MFYKSAVYINKDLIRTQPVVTASFNFYKPFTQLNKESVSETIKNFFLFKDNSLYNLYNKYEFFFKKTLYLDSMFNSNSLLADYGSKNYVDSIKFILPSFLLKKSIIGNIKLLESLFNINYMKNKFFFKKQKYIYNSVYLQKFDITELFNLVYCINLEKNKHASNYFIKTVCVYINNRYHVSGSYYPKTGDSIRFSFFNKYIKFLINTIKKTEYSYAKKIYQNIDLKLEDFNSYKYKLFYLNKYMHINIEYSYITNNFFFINYYSIQKYNYIYKNFINLYSWRIYDWFN